MTTLHQESVLSHRVIPGPSLYVITTMPEGRPKAMIGLLHGYGDHAARYQHVADAWAAKGVGTIAIDMRGHGRAAGQRGYCRRFDEFLDDAAELARLVREKASGVPTFFVGHSFGGLVAAASVLEAQRTWRGLVLSSPFFGLAMDVPQIKVAAGRFASRFFPRLALPNGLTGDHVTHVRSRAAEYDRDPLAFKTATARWFDETEKAQARVLDQAGALKLPLSVIVGSADPVAKVSDGRLFFDRAGSEDKTWTEHDTLLHETMSEFEWPVVAADIAAWVLERAT